MMATLQSVIQSSLTMRRKLHAEEGGAARHKELGPLMRPGHCLTSPDPPTSGIPLCDRNSHENVFHRPPSTWRVNDQKTQLLHFDFYHPSFH